MVDIESPSTIYPILEEVDIPYIPSEFQALKDRYGDNVNSNQTVVGRYLGKMKLSQYADLTYADTERIMEEEARQKELAEEIKKNELQKYMEEGLSEEEARGKVGEPEFDFGDIFTKEEKKELLLKWGQHYTSEELLQLETFYENMHASFDISTASHEDYLMQIAKISLRMHAAINIGDFESHKNLAMSYDRLMKSAKFAASQGKEEEKFVDSVSEITRLCEEKGFIPVFHTDEPQDVVDVTIRDIKMYTQNLVENEHNLGELIEQSLKTIELEREKDLLEETDELDMDDLFGDTSPLTEDDLLEDLFNTEVSDDDREEE